jgi:hypothetical protein
VTIVTARPPRKKPPKPAQPTEVSASPRIVQHRPKWQRERKVAPHDAEAEAGIEAFFLRMGLTLPDDWMN